MWWLLACAPATPPGPGLPPDQDDLVVQERVYVDDTRPTPALGELAGAPERTLHTWVWVGPGSGAEAVERPLLVIAHGFDGHPDKFAAFASDLAARGVVVAAPAFPVTSFGSGAGVLGAQDLGEQPADLSVVLDGLLRDRDDADGPLWHRFDAARVATLGHSLGGATVLGWTRFDGADERVRAVATLSAAVPLTSVFGGLPAAAGPPMAVAHGLEDGTLDPRISRDLYAATDEPVWFLGLAGAGHSDPLEGDEVPAPPARQGLEDYVAALLAEVLDGEDGAVAGVLQERAAQGDEIGG